MAERLSYFVGKSKEEIAFELMDRVSGMTEEERKRTLDLYRKCLKIVSAPTEDASLMARSNDRRPEQVAVRRQLDGEF